MNKNELLKLAGCELPSLEGRQVTEPGQYICLPVCGWFAPQPVWIVRVFQDQGYLCYLPPDGEPRVIAGCGHRFFKLGSPL